MAVEVSESFQDSENLPRQFQFAEILFRYMYSSPSCFGDTYGMSDNLSLPQQDPNAGPARAGNSREVSFIDYEI